LINNNKYMWERFKRSYWGEFICEMAVGMLLTAIYLLATSGIIYLIIMTLTGGRI